MRWRERRGRDRDLDELRAALDQVGADVRALRDELLPVLLAVASEEPRNRRELERARAAASYPAAFDDPDPLVTVCIPTFDRAELLTTRALPSVLAQTHANLEVLVVGDAAPPAVAAAVRGMGDDRVRWFNLTHRIEHEDPVRHWAAGSVQARNLAYAQARGHWIADFDDDDELLPDALAQALALARDERLEVVYGRQRSHLPGGDVREIGVFPPRLGAFSFQGAIVHGGLRGFAREHVAAAYGLPNDWERMLRMLRAGVRVGMLDEVVADMYPSREWGRPTP